MNENEVWENITEVHLRTGFAIKAIRKFCDEKRIPHYKISSRLRFKTTEIIAWMNAGKIV